MNPHDHFNWLVGLRKESPVLFVGKGWESWRAGFAYSHCIPSPDWWPRLGSVRYEMIFFRPPFPVKGRRLLSNLRYLRLCSGNACGFLILADNLFAATRLKRMFSRASLSRVAVPRGNAGLYGIRRAIPRAGLPSGALFIPMPDPDRLEEIVRADSPMLELAHHHHPVLRLARRWGLYPWVAEGFLSLHLPRALEKGPLFSAIAQHLVQTDQAVPAVTLQRVDMRARGAMILFVRQISGDRSWIVRVTAHPRISAIVARNHAFLDCLHDSSAVPHRLRRLLPRPLHHFDYAGRTLFIETMCPGVPAWKVNHGALIQRIHHEATHFIAELNLVTGRRKTLRVEDLNALLGQDLKRLDQCPSLTPSLGRQCDALAQTVRCALEGQELFLAVGHGDYGYGNILVDPRSGHLTGVIDWDTGSLQELVGVDLINMEIQKVRSERRTGFYHAFVTVARAITEQGGLDRDGTYANAFGIWKNRLPALLATAVLRYIARAAQYPEIFRGEQEDYIQAIRLFDVWIRP